MLRLTRCVSAASAANADELKKLMTAALMVPGLVRLAPI